MQFKIIVSDPPWPFSDKLTMSSVKRGAESNYDILSMQDIKNLAVKDIADDNSVLALWVPSSLLKDGIEVMEEWGFDLKQTHVWVKTKKNPFKIIIKAFKKLLKNVVSEKTSQQDALEKVDRFNDLVDTVLAFGMGRLFRQTHELVLIGTRGKVYSELQNRSQRSVHFYPATKHSQKPELLQDMLDKMFPKGKRLEMFARRSRQGWTCVGGECPSTMGEDIRDTLERLKS